MKVDFPVFDIMSSHFNTIGFVCVLGNGYSEIWKINDWESVKYYHFVCPHFQLLVSCTNSVEDENAIIMFKS